MFKTDDFVQAKTGGPKMLVLRVEGDTLWCARVDDATKKDRSQSGQRQPLS